MNGSSFSELFKPMDIANRTTRNRIVLAPMSVCYGDEAGMVTRPEIEHYARRAEGGAGVIITENFAVSAAGRQMPRQTIVEDRRSLPGLRDLASEIRQKGALAIVQIVHAGRYAGPWHEYEKRRRLAPSAVPFELSADRIVTPHEMTSGEIEESIDAFGSAAELCEEAGFDGVDIHGGQGFLISSFLSPRMNQRTDEWGGGYENRLRFPLAVVREVVRRTSAGFLVGWHMMSDELAPGGWSIKDSLRLVPHLTAERIAFIVPTPATFETLRMPANLGLYGKRMYSVSDAAAVKAVSDVPVIANGRLGDPYDAERVLNEGVADAIGLARPLFVDPDWPTKVAAGNIPGIRHCPCDPPTCLRTQLTGALCDHWPNPVIEQGYLGYGM
ncbi:MAG: NADH:flavin oxidoreductase [Actinobacteria bacterium]|nr:NADH:flavin oxidoreductase [Actinomycetota bacterium]